MVSPLFIPMPDLFGEGVAARQQAQRDFANKLGQLYAGGDQAAGQALVGIAPEHANAIRQSLESMPESQLGQVKKRADLLKKWHYAINNEPDEKTRGLMYNQMLAQVAQSGGDISGLSPQYTPEALQQQTQELLSFDELVGTQKEARIRASAEAGGTMAERDRQILINGDPNSQEWRAVYTKEYLRPKRTFNPVTGREILDWEIADPEVVKKAKSIGWPINASTQAVFDIENGAPGAPLPGAVKQDVPAPTVQPAKVETIERPPSVEVDPGMSRAEREKIAGEERAAAREREKLSPMPQYMLDAITSNRAQIRRLKSIEQLASDPEAAAALGAKNMIPGMEQFGKYLRSSEQNDLVGLIAGLQSMTYKDLSGAAVSVQEEARLQKYVPSVTDKPETVKRKVARFFEEYEQINKDLEQAAKSQGYKPLSESDEDAPPAVGPAGNEGWSYMGVKK